MVYEAKTIPEAVRQFQQAALPHVSAIVKALGVPFNNSKSWKESKGTAGQWYRSDERDRIHFVMPVPLLKATKKKGVPQTIGDPETEAAHSLGRTNPMAKPYPVHGGYTRRRVTRL